MEACIGGLIIVAILFAPYAWLLRHKKFPLVIIFRDPKENWDDIVKDKIIEQIKQNGFDDFVVTEEIPEEEPMAP